jgi:uncharacterized protein YdaU (DUF1376 family)
MRQRGGKNGAAFVKYQWMPLFWGDLFANTLHLSAEEFGSYMLLIGHAWEHQAKIPVKDLQRIARASNFRWHKIQPRLAQFFNTMIDANNWIHDRVLMELTIAGEISNKRKGAAMQMHAKRRASACDLHSHTTLHSLESSSNGKEGGMQMHPPEFEHTQSYTPSGMSPDKGLDYRSPPRNKSDNTLQPIPDKPKG